MTYENHVAILRQGVAVWNEWRSRHRRTWPDLMRAKLRGRNLSGADLSGTNLREANLTGAKLRAANLTGAVLFWTHLPAADLRGADLRGLDFSTSDLRAANLAGADLRDSRFFEAGLQVPSAAGGFLSGRDVAARNLAGASFAGANLAGVDLSGVSFNGVDLAGANLASANLAGADLTRARLTNADLSGADLAGAHLGLDLAGVKLCRCDVSGLDLTGADLTGADLSATLLIETTLRRANLSGCRVYGTAIWKVDLTDAAQENLIITPTDEPDITVDNLKVAQFVYLLLNNAEIRDVIDTISRKVVLILGRFTPRRKVVLEALRAELRRQGYLPILFDFETPANRDLTETVSTLAHMSRFVIADLTEAKSIPQELQAIVPNLPSVPVQAILKRRSKLYAMFEHFTRYPCVLPVYRYDDQETLIAALGEYLIAPAEVKARELAQR